MPAAVNRTNVAVDFFFLLRKEGFLAEGINESRRRLRAQSAAPLMLTG